MTDLLAERLATLRKGDTFTLMGDVYEVQTRRYGVDTDLYAKARNGNEVKLAFSHDGHESNITMEELKI